MISAVILAAALSGAEPAGGVKFFEGTWAEATAKASEKKSLVFVDFYTDW